MTKINIALFDEFEQKIIEAAYLSLEQKQNPIRLNNFCYAVREALSQFFNRNAPAKEVKLCRWYKKPIIDEIKKGAKEVNLRQKIHFALHGGIAPKHPFFRALKMENQVSELLKKYKELNSFTHINRKKYDCSDKEIENQLSTITKNLDSFFIKYNSLRSKIINKIEQKTHEKIEENLTESFTRELGVYGVVDAYAPNLDEITINYIGHDNIQITIHGNATGQQRLGGKRDGIDMYTNFPFSLPACQNVGFRRTAKINWYGIKIDETPWTG